MSGLENKDLKSARTSSLAVVVALIADEAKRDAGREVQPGREDRDLKALWDNDVLTLAGIEFDRFGGTQRVCNGRRSGGTWQNRDNDASCQASKKSGFGF